MKKLLFTLSFAIGVLAIPQNTSAQNSSNGDHKISFGVRAGMNISSMGGDFKKTFSESTDLNSKVGFNIGAIVDIPVWKELYVQPGLFFTTKGAKSKFAESNEEDGETFKYEEKGTFNAMYLEIPILLSYRFNLNENIKWHINFGPYIALGIGGKAKFENTENEEKEEADFFGKSEDSFGFNRFDAGLSFGTGLSFKHYYIGLQYELGLTNAANKDYWGEKTSIKMNNLAISLGYNF